MATLFPHDPAAETGPVPSGFNSGAFLFAPVFFLWYRRAGLALLGFALNAAPLFLLGGPCGVLLAPPLSLALGVYAGFHANEVAWETQRFATYDELRSSMFRWNLAGAVAVVLFVIWVVMKSP